LLEDGLLPLSISSHGDKIFFVWLGGFEEKPFEKEGVVRRAVHEFLHASKADLLGGELGHGLGALRHGVL
jgi:hypothetical protein